jgi:hypothetical protein
MCPGRSDDRRHTSLGPRCRETHFDAALRRSDEHPRGHVRPAPRLMTTADHALIADNVRNSPHPEKASWHQALFSPCMAS